MIMMKSVPALLGTLILGACAATPPTVVTHQYVDQDFYRGQGYNAAVRDGAAPVTVVGTAFRGIDAAASLAPLKPPAAVAARRFVPAGDDGTRVVLIFHPKAPLAQADACAPAATLAANAGAADAGDTSFSVLASLCQGRRLVSTAMVSGPAPASPADPAYGEIIGQALVEILPLTLPREVPSMP